jgi:hypothetical protein
MAGVDGSGAAAADAKGWLKQTKRCETKSTNGSDATDSGRLINFFAESACDMRALAKQGMEFSSEWPILIDGCRR